MNKRIFCIIFSFISLILFSILGGCDTQEISTPSPIASDDIPEDEDESPIPSEQEKHLADISISEDGTIGSWHVTFAGATNTQLSDGKPALIVYYDFTNNSDKSVSPFMALDISAYQNDRTLNTVRTLDNIPYHSNSSLRVRPGTTLRCSILFEILSPDGDVSVLISDWKDPSSQSAYASFNLNDLPGEIGSYDISAIPTPEFTDDYPSEMNSNGISLTIAPESSLTSGWEGEPCIRFYVDYSNNSEFESSFSNEFTAVAYQDGVELLTVASAESVPEDSNSWKLTPSGSQVRLSLVYALRSTSPVEFEIYSKDGFVVGTERGVV